MAGPDMQVALCRWKLELEYLVILLYKKKSSALVFIFSNV